MLAALQDYAVDGGIVRRRHFYLAASAGVDDDGA